MEAQRETQEPIQPPGRINIEMSEAEASLLFTLTSQIAGYTGDDPAYAMITDLYYALQSAGIGRIKGRLVFTSIDNEAVEVRTSYIKESK